MHVEVVMFI